ncbi:unnamed protein product [Owenia fusiformis]|uniref:Proline-rich transmembrane protein 3/4 domain-containing protein n=1 Tax=Owenia fusiformis TaxID=6347 RepID=A0A8J1XFH0_OWEFU|nr:unnamed protein product [Owenia fusiformis]
MWTIYRFLAMYGMVLYHTLLWGLLLQFYPTTGLQRQLDLYDHWSLTNGFHSPSHSRKNHDYKSTKNKRVIHESHFMRINKIKYPNLSDLSNLVSKRIRPMRNSNLQELTLEVPKENEIQVSDALMDLNLVSNSLLLRLYNQNRQTKPNRRKRQAMDYDNVNRMSPSLEDIVKGTSSTESSENLVTSDGAESNGKLTISTIDTYQTIDTENSNGVTGNIHGASKTIYHTLNHDSDVNTGTAAELSDTAAEMSDMTVEMPDTIAEIPDTTAEMPDMTVGMLDTIAEIPDTTAEMPDMTVEMPDTTADMSATTAEMSETTTEMPDTTAEIPDTTAEMPDITVEMSDTPVEISDTTAEMPDTTAEMSNIATEMPDMTVEMPYTTAEISDSAAAMPDTTAANVDTSAEMTNKTTDLSDSTAAIPDTTAEMPDTTADISGLYNSIAAIPYITSAISDITAEMPEPTTGISKSLDMSLSTTQMSHNFPVTDNTAVITEEPDDSTDISASSIQNISSQTTKEQSNITDTMISTGLRTLDVTTVQYTNSEPTSSIEQSPTTSPETEITIDDMSLTTRNSGVKGDEITEMTSNSPSTVELEITYNSTTHFAQNDDATTDESMLQETAMMTEVPLETSKSRFTTVASSRETRHVNQSNSSPTMVPNTPLTPTESIVTVTDDGKLVSIETVNNTSAAIFESISTLDPSMNSSEEMTSPSNPTNIDELSTIISEPQTLESFVTIPLADMKTVSHNYKTTTSPQESQTTTDLEATLSVTDGIIKSDTTFESSTVGIDTENVTVKSALEPVPTVKSTNEQSSTPVSTSAQVIIHDSTSNSTFTPELTSEPGPSPVLTSETAPPLEPTSEPSPEPTREPTTIHKASSERIPTFELTSEPVPEPTSQATRTFKSTSESVSTPKPTRKQSPTPMLTSGTVSTPTPSREQAPTLEPTSEPAPDPPSKPTTTPKPSSEPAPDPPSKPTTTPKPSSEPVYTTKMKSEPTSEPESSSWPDISDSIPEPEMRPTLPPYAEPEPDWSIAKPILQEAWEVHVYLVGVLFALLALYSLVSIIRLYNNKHLLSQGYFIALNALMFIMGSFRAVYFLVDAYNSNRTFPIWLSYFMYGIGLPCLTSAFSVLFLALLQTTKMQLLSPRIQKLSCLILIIALHFILHIVADVLIAFFFDSKIIVLICQIFFCMWGLILFGGYFYIFRKLYKSAVKRQKTMMASSVSLMKYKLQDVIPIRKPHKLTLGIAVKITFVTAIFGLICAILQIYAMAGVYSVFSQEIPQPWPWWGFQFAQRLTELAMCFTMSYVATQPFRYNKPKQRSSCKMFDSYFFAPCCRICRGDSYDINEDLDLGWDALTGSMHDSIYKKDIAQFSLEEVHPLHTGANGHKDNVTNGNAQKYSTLQSSSSGSTTRPPSSMLVIEDGRIRFRLENEIEESIPDLSSGEEETSGSHYWRESSAQPSDNSNTSLLKHKVQDFNSGMANGAHSPSTLSHKSPTPSFKFNGTSLTESSDSDFRPPSPLNLNISIENALHRVLMGQTGTSPPKSHNGLSHPGSVKSLQGNYKTCSVNGSSEEDLPKSVELPRKFKPKLIMKVHSSNNVDAQF